MPDWKALLIALLLVAAITGLNMLWEKCKEARRQRKKAEEAKTEEAVKFFKALDIKV